MYINTSDNYDSTFGSNLKIRRCGNYWEYCDGNCNSCKNHTDTITTDHSIIGNSYVYTSSETKPHNIQEV